MCPGEEAVFSCTVIDDGSGLIRWTANTTGNDCINVLAITDSVDTCGAFMAVHGSPVSTCNCYHSNLIVTASPAVDNSFIQCFGPGLNDQVGSATLSVIGMQ